MSRPPSTPLAAPCSSCCTRSPTVQHSGTARGTVETIAGLATYIARPSAPTHQLKVILFFADVFGPLYPNSKLAMDYWAEHGFLVLGPDYFEGDSCAHHAGEPGWDVDVHATYFIQIFGGARHGFATRPDPDLPAERWAKEECARATVAWFEYHGGLWEKGGKAVLKSKL